MIVEDEYDAFSPIAKLRDIYPTLMNSSDLLSLEIPEINWVIPKLLPAGLALLAGEPKIGKSYFLLKLAKDITENGGKVFYFAGEDSSYLLQKRLKELDLDVGEDLIVHCGRDTLLSEPRKREECLFKFDGSHHEAKLKKNSGQYVVYEYIRDHPDCLQKQIAEDAGIKKQNVSRNIKILVARGYVVGNNNIGFRVTRMLDDLDDSDDQ